MKTEVMTISHTYVMLFLKEKTFGLYSKKNMN